MSDADDPDSTTPLAFTPATPIGVHASQSAAVPAEGSTVGRYLVVGQAGRGGMGLVLRAYDPKLLREVALKRLHPASGMLGEGQSRLLREARAMAKLNHPHVVAVYDVEEIGGEALVVMEYVEGTTLRRWMAEGPRPWAEVLGVLTQCARGLAAAHAAGLVHRDFKPSNVLVTVDGQAKVMDFGLARSDALTTAMPPSNADDPDELVTRDDVVLGTPAYMAPEQYEGAPPDARADQYALCITLWEALWGERPFAGSMKELARAKRRGPPAPPSGGGIPSWLAAVVRRGLAPSPEDRFEGIPELLKAIERGRGAARLRRAGLVLSAVAVGGVALVAWRRADEAAREAECQAAGAVIEQVWNDDARQRIASGLRASGAYGAEVTIERITPWLDRYAASWREARTTACLDATVRHLGDADTDARASWCLEEGRLRLDALVASLARASIQTHNRAGPAAAGLPPVDLCLDADRLRRLPVPPAADREKILALRAELSAILAMEDTSQLQEALQAAEAVVQRADALGWPPLSASARYDLAGVYEDLGRYPETEATLEEAYFGAVGAGALDVAASAANSLSYLTGSRLARVDDGIRWSRHARLALDALGEAEGPRMAVHLNDLGLLRMSQQRLDEAMDLQQQALAMRERLYGPDNPFVAMSYNNIGLIYRRQDRLQDAGEAYAHAVEIRERTLGPEHPLVARALNNLAGILHDTGQSSAARSMWERSLGIVERTVGSEHPEAASIFANLAANHDREGNSSEAKALYERALAGFERTLGSDHPDTTKTLADLASVHAKLGDTDQATEMLASAVRRIDDPLARFSARMLVAQGLWEHGETAQARSLAELARDDLPAEAQAERATLDAWLAERSGTPPRHPPP